MIRLSKTKILNSIDKIDFNLNTIYDLDTDYERLEKQILIELLETIKDWKTELKLALSFEPEHLSLYQLTIEPNTAFGKLFGDCWMTLNQLLENCWTTVG